MSNPLLDNVVALLAQRGKQVDFAAARPLVVLRQDADDKGPFIEKWDASLGDPPTQADGFSAHELHMVRP